MAKEIIEIKFDVDYSELEKAREEIECIRSGKTVFSLEFVFCMLSCLLLGIVIGILL